MMKTVDSSFFVVSSCYPVYMINLHILYILLYNIWRGLKQTTPQLGLIAPIQDSQM